MNYSYDEDEIKDIMIRLGLDYMQAYYHVRQKKELIERAERERVFAPWRSFSSWKDLDKTDVNAY